MTTRSTATLDPSLLRLSELVASRPELKAVAGFYQLILPLLNTADLGTQKPDLAPTELQQKIRAGTPLLHHLDLAFDADAARGLMIRLTEAYAQWAHAQAGAAEGTLSGSLPPESARAIQTALETNALDLRQLFARVLAGDVETVNQRAQALKLDPGLVWTLAQNTFKPALRAWQKHLAARVEADEWRRPICFVCGAPPTFGELQGSEQVRHLRCGQCGADWVFPRLRCVYCGYDRHDKLNNLYPGDQPKRWHAQTCDHCQGYFKNLITFDPTPAEMIAVADLATLYLDYLAQAQGYRRNAITDTAEDLRPGY
jgi:FdhE protein